MRPPIAANKKANVATNNGQPTKTKVKPPSVSAVLAVVANAAAVAPPNAQKLCNSNKLTQQLTYPTTQVRLAIPTLGLQHLAAPQNLRQARQQAKTNGVKAEVQLNQHSRNKKTVSKLTLST